MFKSWTQVSTSLVLYIYSKFWKSINWNRSLFHASQAEHLNFTLLYPLPQSLLMTTKFAVKEPKEIHMFFKLSCSYGINHCSTLKRRNHFCPPQKPLESSHTNLGGDSWVWSLCSLQIPSGDQGSGSPGWWAPCAWLQGGVVWRLSAGSVTLQSRPVTTNRSSHTLRREEELEGRSKPRKAGRLTVGQLLWTGCEL